MSKVSTILERAKTDRTFYKLVQTDFQTVVKQYKLNAKEIKQIRKGLKGYVMKGEETDE